MQADETITVPGQANRQWTHQYAYDMLSQLILAQMDRADTQPLDCNLIYQYYKDGNIEQKTANGQSTDFDYNGDLMTYFGNDQLTWEPNNAQLTTGLSGYQFYYNWDGKLKDVNDSSGNRLISLKYDPFGNRVYKWSADPNTQHAGVRYIVDISGGLPTILCEVNDVNSSLINSYFYADGQILTQQQYRYTYVEDYYENVLNCDNFEYFMCRNAPGGHTHEECVQYCTTEWTLITPAHIGVNIIPYFYIHDRLGSIRQVVDANGTVVNSYTYNPFGEDISAADCIESIYNPFKFTGQWYDSEIGQYYLRARMYDPQLMRFTARDPDRGEPKEPLTFHKYLYTVNNSTNRTDPTGCFAFTDLLLGTNIGYGIDAGQAGVSYGALGQAIKIASQLAIIVVSLILWVMLYMNHTREKQEIFHGMI